MAKTQPIKKLSSGTKEEKTNKHPACKFSQINSVGYSRCTNLYFWGRRYNGTEKNLCSINQDTFCLFTFFLFYYNGR